MDEEDSTYVGYFFRTSCQVKADRLQFQEEAVSNVESSKIWKLENFENIKNYPWDMLNNFCFHVYAQKSLIISEIGNVYFLTSSTPSSPATPSPPAPPTPPPPSCKSCWQWQCSESVGRWMSESMDPKNESESILGDESSMELTPLSSSLWWQALLSSATSWAWKCFMFKM